MTFQTGLLPGVIWVVAVGVFLYRHPIHIDARDETTYQEGDKRRHDPAS